MNNRVKDENALYRLFSNTVMMYVVQISNYIFPLFTFPYLTRVLGAEKYGVVVFTNAIMAYFQTFIEFGFLLSATKECAIHRDEREKLERIVSSVIQAKILLAVIGFAVLCILICVNSKFAEKGIYILLSYLPYVVNVFLLDFLFRGMEQMQIITTRLLVSKVVYTVLIFLKVKKPEDYLWIPIITSIGNLVTVIWTWEYVAKEWKIKLHMAKIRDMFETLKMSAVFFLSRIASTVYSSSNVVALGMFFSDAAMGIFGTANNLITNGRAMFSPIADSIYPYMIKEKNYKLIKKILIIMLPIIIIGTVGLYILAEPIIVIVCGEAYRESYVIFRAMLPLIVLALPVYLMGYPVLGAMGKMREANFSVIAGAVFHLCGLGILMLCDKFTFISVSLLTSVTETVVLTIRIYYAVFADRRKDFRHENERNHSS